jgi:glycosyltransferase involved in cell wall biosynthesis
MRILLVGRHHGERIRGATVALHGLARALSARGHAVTLLQSASPEHRVALDGVAMRYLTTSRKSLYPLLFAWIRRGDQDIVHAYDESGAFLALRARLEGLPMVAHLNPPVVHYEPFWRAGWRWRYIGMATRFAPSLVTPSEWLANGLADRYGRARSDFHAVPNGVGEHWFAAGAARVSRPTRGVLRIALVNMKGVPVALRAFARLVREREASLELFGSHALESDYRRMAEELGIAERVRFRGFVANAGLPAEVAQADVLLHPTESESFGVVLAEAAALGLPVVASRVNAVPEVVHDGTTGVLCPLGDADAFARGLRLLADDPDLRARMARAARERALARWRWDPIAERLEREVYAPLLRP